MCIQSSHDNAQDKLIEDIVELQAKSKVLF